MTTRHLDRNKNEKTFISPINQSSDIKITTEYVAPLTDILYGDIGISNNIKIQIFNLANAIGFQMDK